MWDEQARALRGRYRVLRFDTRGHGQTSAPAGAYTLDQLADDLKGLLDGLGIEQTHFVGLSMGGMIGQIFALKHPAMVQSLVALRHHEPLPAAAPRRSGRSASRRWAPRAWSPWSAPTLERWFTAPFRARRKDLMERVGAMIRATPAAGYIGCCHAHPEDQRHRAAAGRRAVPALVIVGEEDPGTPVEMAREIHAALPVGGAGHPALGLASVESRAARGVQPRARRLPRQG